MIHNILHIVDMQYDFVAADGKLAVPGAYDLIQPANDFLGREQMDLVIATFDTHDAKTYAASAEGKMFPPHCIRGTRGWQSVLDLPKNTVRVMKDQFDVWGAPDAMKRALGHIKPAGAGVYVMGVASDFCVKYAIAGYLARGYSVTVLVDLCRGIERQMSDVVREFDNQKLRLVHTAELTKQRGK